jgi:hypothetical protein
MTRLTNWTREHRTPTLAYRHTETEAQAALHRAPNSYVHTELSIQRTRLLLVHAHNQYR